MTKQQEEKLIKEIEELRGRVTELEEYNDLHKLNRYSYTVSEVAKMLDKRPQTIRNMIQRGELEANKSGVTRITGESLRKALGMKSQIK